MIVYRQNHQKLGWYSEDFKKKCQGRLLDSEIKFYSL
jgi:hypothetical protein